MTSSTEYDGIRFFEEVPKGCTDKGPISTEIKGMLKSAQMSNLGDVKAKMAAECKSRGGNAIVGFKYGQRSSGFFGSILSRDDVHWYGSGNVAVVPKSLI